MTETTTRPGRQTRVRRAFSTALAMVTAVLCTMALASAPAEAATKKSKFTVAAGHVATAGTFTWNTKSAKVTAYVHGHAYGGGKYACGAAVFTAYDKKGKQIARRAEPGDNIWNCHDTKFTFGVTLKGKIYKLVVSLWEWDSPNGGKPHLVKTRTYKHP